MNYQLFVGTYTGGEQSDSVVTNSKGIYSFKLDPQIGSLKLTGAYSHGDIDPSFFAIRGGILYTENERKDMGTLRSFAIQKDGSLSFVDKAETKGSKCVYVCVDDFGPYLFGTNYASGSVMVMKSDAAGQLTLTDLVQHYGSSIVPVRQDAPHAHSVRQTPDGKGIIIPDLGIDKVMNYLLDRETGKLKPNTNQESISVTPGDGPRHFVFHPNRKFAYLLTEIGNRIYVYSFDEAIAVLTELQTISVLPESFTGVSHSAEIIISKDGTFLYTSNRGHDTIAGFAVDPFNGKLESIGFWPSGGKSPRHICLGPNENYIIAANKDSNDVCVIQRNTKTGVLGKVIQKEEVPAPACVRWTVLPAE